MRGTIKAMDLECLDAMHRKVAEERRPVLVRILADRIRSMSGSRRRGSTDENRGSPGPATYSWPATDCLYSWPAVVASPAPRLLHTVTRSYHPRHLLSTGWRKNESKRREREKHFTR